MLCSASTVRSSTNWLERLRSTRGIPTSDAEGIDHFLLGNPPTEANPNTDPTSVPPSVPAAVVSRPQSQGVREIVTSILSDLFDMGGTVREPALETRRSSRKQPNPRFLPCFQDRVRASSLDSWWDERGKEGLEENAGADDVGKEGRCVGDGMEKEAEDDDEGLMGYSRSEVTIIDTSCEVWKFEKVVYRRKDVWKVRDRKGKGRGKLRKTKKRKLGGSETDVRRCGGKRKAVEFLNEGPNSVEKDERSLENEMGVIGGNIEARASFYDSVARTRDSGSSVALIKVMPVNIKKTKVLN